MVIVITNLHGVAGSLKKMIMHGLKKSYSVKYSSYIQLLIFWLYVSVSYRPGNNHPGTVLCYVGIVFHAYYNLNTIV